MNTQWGLSVNFGILSVQLFSLGLCHMNCVSLSFIAWCPVSSDHCCFSWSNIKEKKINWLSFVWVYICPPNSQEATRLVKRVLMWVLLNSRKPRLNRKACQITANKNWSSLASLNLDSCSFSFQSFSKHLSSSHYIQPLIAK